MAEEIDSIIRVLVKFGENEEPQCWRCHKKALYRCGSCGTAFCCRECFARDWQHGTHTKKVCKWLRRGYGMYASAMKKLGMLETDNVGEPNGYGTPPGPEDAKVPAHLGKPAAAERKRRRMLVRFKAGVKALRIARMIVAKIIANQGALDAGPALDDVYNKTEMEEIKKKIKKEEFDLIAENLHNKMLKAIREYIAGAKQPTIDVAPEYDLAEDQDFVELAEGEMQRWIDDEKAKKRWMYTPNTIQLLREFTQDENVLFYNAIYAAKYKQPCFKFPDIQPDELIEFALFFGKMTRGMVADYLRMVRDDDETWPDLRNQSVIFSGVQIPRATRNFDESPEIQQAAAEANMHIIGAARFCMVAHYYEYQAGTEQLHHWSAFVFDLRASSDKRVKCHIYDSASHIYHSTKFLKNIGKEYAKLIKRARKAYPPLTEDGDPMDDELLAALEDQNGYVFKIVDYPLWFQKDNTSCGVYTCDVIRRVCQRDFPAARLNEAVVRKKMTMELLRGSLLTKRKT